MAVAIQSKKLKYKASEIDAKLDQVGELTTQLNSLSAEGSDPFGGSGDDVAFSANAVSYDPTSTYNNGSIGKEVSDLALKVNDIGINVETAIPDGGVLAPNVMYNLGTLSGNISFEIGADTATDGELTKQNVYAMTFAMPSSGSAPTITYPANLTWVGGSGVTPALGKKYELSIMNHIIAMIEV